MQGKGEKGECSENSYIIKTEISAEMSNLLVYRSSMARNIREVKSIPGDQILITVTKFRI